MSRLLRLRSLLSANSHKSILQGQQASSDICLDHWSKAGQKGRQALDETRNEEAYHTACSLASQTECHCAIPMAILLSTSEAVGASTRNVASCSNSSLASYPGNANRKL